MNLDAIAEKLDFDLLRSSSEAEHLGLIRAALAQVRDETLEEAAKYLDEQAKTVSPCASEAIRRLPPRDEGEAVSYTPEQLREDAAMLEEMGDKRMADTYRAHAAILEENAKLREMLWKCRGEILEMLARGADAPKSREVAEEAFQLLQVSTTKEPT